MAALLSMASAPAWSVSFSPRYDHTATLLANRDILICGGVENSAGTTFIKSCQISLEDKDNYNNTVADMNVERASHTATLLPDGRVLVAGGRNLGGILSSAEIYNPVTNSWSALIGMSGAVARMNHTATLLETGKVLICGGHNTTALSSCDLFDPSTNGFTATLNPMWAARSAHTATLLRDGRVMLTGGYNPSSTPPYLVTTEVFNPATETFTSAKPLIVARSHHSATLLGNGKVLIAGGINDKNTNNNQGVLDTTETYDPIADNMTPSATLLARVRSHTATLQTDGSPRLIGGLGNITTSYQTNYSALLAAGSFVTGTFAPSNKLSTMNIANIGTPPILNIPLDLSLNAPVNGVIQNGDVYFSCPTIRLPEAEIYFTPGNSASTTGLRVGLNGAAVTNGEILQDTVAVNLQGLYFNIDATLSPDAMTTTGGAAVITGGSLSQSNPRRDLGYASTFMGNMIIRGFSTRFINATISSGIYTVADARLNLASSYTITLGLAYFEIPNTTTIVSDGLGGARTQAFSVIISSVQEGVIEYDGDGSNSFNAGNNSLFINQQLTNVNGRMRFVTNRIDLYGATFQSDVATIVVRSMMFSDVEKYAPNANSWSFDDTAGSARYNHTAVLTADGDIRVHGGRVCNPTFLNINCDTQPPTGESTLIPRLPAWSQLSGGSNMVNGQRANHTATLLPDGRILVAGGSNGPNILGTAELFDPQSNTFSSVGEMRSVRDLHTATLLPNGRVLVAGGFSTNALSTGAVNRAEIYYPDARLWLPTEMMVSSRSNHTATLLADGSVLVVGGKAAGNYLNSVEIFFSTSLIWRGTTSLPENRALHSATLLKDGRVLVVGGLNAGGILGTYTLFNPATGIWSASSLLPSSIRTHSHSATLLQDGRVLIAGGNDEYGELNLSLIYDPAGNSWTQTTDASLGGNALSSARFAHTTTLLPNGLVVVAGGAQAGGSLVLSQVETFNVGGSTWTSAGKMVSRRSFHTTTLAKNGYLYSIGGYDSVNYLSSVERTYMGLPIDVNTTGAPPSPRQPEIKGVDRAVFDRNELLTSTGLNFHGITEAAGGGSGPMNSSHQSPRLALQSIGGGEGGSSFLLDLSTRQVSPVSWTLSNTSITVSLPSVAGELPYGWYHLRVGANAQYSDSVLVQAGPAKPLLPVTNLSGAAQSTTTMLWTWTQALGSFDGYNVYSATTGVFITTLPVTSVSLLQTDLFPNASAQIWVAPFKLTGDGPLAVSTTFFTLANPVTNLVISDVKSASLQLNWSANSNRNGTVYEISQSTDNFITISTPVPASHNLQTTFYLVTPLADNSTFYFRVRAFNGASIPAAFSAIVSTRTRSTVFGLQATPLNTTSIQWGWLDPGGVVNYRVYSATSGALLDTLAPTSPSFTQTGISTNAAASIQVSVITGAGEGPLSDSVTAYTMAAVPLPGAPPLINVTTGSFRVSWFSNNNPPGTTYMAEISSTDFVISKTTNITTNLQAGFGDLLDPAEIWKIRVKAFNADNTPSSALVIGSTPTLPRTPVNLNVTGTTPSSIQVSWDNDGNASSATYQVTYSSRGFANGYNGVAAVPFSLGFNGSAATITGLLSSTTYEIRVAARNSVGNNGAGFSNTVSTRTSNGGAVLGSLAGVLSAGLNNVITGSLGSDPPRTILLQSPVGAFPSNVTLTISSFNVAGNTLCSNPFSSSIGLTVTTDPPLQPNKSVYLTFSYAAAEIGALPTDRLVLARHEPTAGKCVPLPTTVDTTAKTITASLNHFSNFQVVAVSPAAAVGLARIFPNPWYAGRVGQVTFHQLPAFARVRIFTLKGELVTELSANASGLVAWDGVNRGGRRVASGVYLAVFEDRGAKKILKLAVIQ